MNRKNLSINFILVGVLIFLGVGCDKKTVVPDNSISAVQNVENETEKSELKEPMLSTSSGITDEQCLEIIAHQLWASQLMIGKNDLASASIESQKANELQKQYGISDEDFENMCNVKMGDMNFLDRLEERMKELGFVIE